MVYGRKMEYYGPVYKSHEIEGNKVRIAFTHIGQGLALQHGDKLQGKDDTPGIAGRSPVYIARQLYQFKTDIRKGPYAEMMKTVAAKLTDDDIISIASYVASLDPA